MADVRPAQLDEYSLTRLLASSGGELGRRHEALWQAIWRQPYVPAPVLEICRLRLAQLHGVAHDFDLPPVSGAREDLDPETVAMVLAGSPDRAPHLPAGARAAVELAEVYVQDPHAIAGELSVAVKAHFGEAGFVALIEAFGVIDGRIRLGRMLGALLPSEKSSG